MWNAYVKSCLQHSLVIFLMCIGLVVIYSNSFLLLACPFNWSFQRSRFLFHWFSLLFLFSYFHWFFFLYLYFILSTFIGLFFASPFLLLEEWAWSYRLEISSSVSIYYYTFPSLVNTKIRLIVFFAAEDGEALYSQQRKDLELTVAQVINSLLQNTGSNWRK